MSTAAKAWLPLEAFGRDALRHLVAGAVDEWISEWLGDSRHHLGRWQPISAANAQTLPGPWRLIGKSAAVRMPKTGQASWLQLALGAGSDTSNLQDADRQLISAFELRALTDLGARIERSLGVQAGPAPEVLRDVGRPLVGQGGVVATISTGHGDELFSIALPAETLIPSCKTVAAGGTSRAPVRRRTDALASTPIPLRAVAGAVTLPFPVATGLEVGDVLVFNDGAAGKASLIGPGPGALRLKAAVAIDNDQVTLTLEA